MSYNIGLRVPLRKRLFYYFRFILVIMLMVISWPLLSNPDLLRKILLRPDLGDINTGNDFANDERYFDLSRYILYGISAYLMGALVSYIVVKD